jgi:hypothetical protein
MYIMQVEVEVQQTVPVALGVAAEVVIIHLEA